MNEFVLEDRTGSNLMSHFLPTCLGHGDLGVVGSEAGEVLLLAGDQHQQHDVSRGQEGQRVMRVSTQPEGRQHS